MSFYLETKTSAASAQPEDTRVLAAILVGPDMLPSGQSVGYDASGRLRVGQLETLNILTAKNADDALMIVNSGTGTGTWTSTGYTMACTGVQWLIRAGKHRTAYVPGRSHQVEITGYRLENQAGCVKRVGYFDSSTVSPHTANFDGFYFESDGTDYRFSIERNGTDVMNVPRASWNGSQAAKDHDFSKFTVFLFDFLWLGGAVFRVFIKTTSGFALAHQFDYAGTEANVFMITPNHRVRYEIRGPGTMTAVCAQVSTEGSVSGVGKGRAVENAAVVPCAAIGTHYPLIAIRLGAGFLDETIKQVGATLYLSSSTDVGIMRICLNPTFSAPLTYAAVPNSAAESAVGNGTITVSDFGSVLYSQFARSDAITPQNILLSDFLSQLGSTVAGVSDQLVVVFTPITTTIDARASLIFKQF